MIPARRQRLMRRRPLLPCFICPVPFTPLRHFWGANVARLQAPTRGPEIASRLSVPSTTSSLTLIIHGLGYARHKAGTDATGPNSPA